MKNFKDSELTSLVNNKKVRKTSLRIESIGIVDELNSFIGIARSGIEEQDIKKVLKLIQNDLFVLSTELADPLQTRITNKEVYQLERIIKEAEEELPLLNTFIISGSSQESAILHTCRSISRRAERSILKLKEHEGLNNETFRYINRLSDVFFTLARLVDKRLKIEEDKRISKGN